MILDIPNEIGTAIIPQYGIKNTIDIIFIILPATYEIPIYLVSRLMLMPDVAKGNNKYIHIGMHKRVKYSVAFRYELLLSSRIISLAISDAVTAITVSPSTII